MTITSVGYPGPITSPQWAGITAGLGADYGVVGPGDLRVSTVPASDRTVKLAAGSAYGKGIFDVSSAEETIQLNPIVSGSRWDLVGFLRTWDGVDSETTVAFVEGTSSQTAAFSLRDDTPGSVDFHPMALVQVTAGSTVPTQVIDLRVWQANGGAVANDTLALQYLNGAGTEVWVGSTLWHRYVDGASALQWKQSAGYTEWIGTVVCAADGTFSGSIPPGIFSTNPTIFASVLSSTQFAFASAAATSATAFSGHCAFSPLLGGVGPAPIGTSGGFTIVIRATAS